MNHKISIYYVEQRVVIHLLLALIVQCWYVFFCSKGLHRHNITLLGVHMSRYSSVCQWIYKSIQGSPRRLYQIVSCKTIIQLAVPHADHGSILMDSNFYFKLEWLELAAGAPLDSCMLQAIREDCLNHKPFSISASFFFFAIPLGISFISCSYSQPPCWLTVNDYFPFCLQPFTVYFYTEVQHRRCFQD